MVTTFLTTKSQKVDIYFLKNRIMLNWDLKMRMRMSLHEKKFL